MAGCIPTLFGTLAGLARSESDFRAITARFYGHLAMLVLIVGQLLGRLELYITPRDNARVDAALALYICTDTVIYNRQTKTPLRASP